MAVDVEPLKAAPPDDHRAAELIEACRSRLGGEWRLINSSVKLSKLIFEAEYNGRRVIGKVSGSKRAQTAFQSLNKLYEAGLRPPSSFTVPEPIAWFEDRKLLVVEKAPGSTVSASIQHGPNARADVDRAADWLICLQSLRVDVPAHVFDARAAEARAAELVQCSGDERIASTSAAAVDVLRTQPSAIVPSHGDYHPMNVFVAPERVTTIDLDTVALREPEADIGYFLAQMANFGLLMFDSMDVTRDLREAFLQRFPHVDHRRVSAHMAWTLLQSLHYDLCILKIKNDKADLMVQAARSVLKTGALDPADA